MNKFKNLILNKKGKFTNIMPKKLLFLVMLLGIFTLSKNVFAQSSANYTFTTNTTSSLATDANANVVDMTTGTTQLVGPGLDATASSLTNIGFTFYFMGNSFSTFGVQEDGLMKLGGTASTNTYTMSGGTLAAPLLAAYNADMRTGTTTGKIHYKVIGSAPNRCLVVEFADMQLHYTSTAAAGTSKWQMRLYETTGKVEYVYGTMNCTSTTTSGLSIGFYTGSATNSFNSVNNATNTNSVTSAYTQNTNVSTGLIPNLNSSADGSRRAYIFTPPTAMTAPTTLSFTSVGMSSMTLNWLDNSTGEIGFVIERSLDNTNWTSITTTAANATSYSASGLNPTTLYYWRVSALSEGTLSTALTGSQTTGACPVFASTISINGAAAVAGISYPNINAAIADLKACGITQPTILELAAGYTAEASYPIVLDTIPGASAVNTITIREASGVTGKVLTSSHATNPTININKGKYYIIDGRSGGVGAADLQITSTGATAPCLQYINEASKNVVKYCTISGINSSSASGLVVFNTTTGTFGNDNNIIDNCSIKDGASTPACMIYSTGSTTTTNTYNDTNKVTNCSIYNFFSAGGNSNGIILNGGNSSWTISGNNFYQTATRTSTASSNHIAINIASANNINVTIKDNFIGGGAVSAGGSAWNLTGAFANRFYGISLVCGTTVKSLVQNNTIANFAFSSNSSASTTGGPFCGIYHNAGTAKIINNTIGNSTTTGNISLTVITNTGAVSSGIWINAATSDSIGNNTIGSVTILGGTTSIGHGYYGIHVVASTTSIDIYNNTIGSTTTANSIYANTVITSAGTQVQAIRGISNAGSSITRITNNTISNLNGVGLGNACKVFGILTSGGTDTISNNTIQNLTGAGIGGGVGPAMAGIELEVASPVVLKNNIRNLLNNTAGAIPLHGIHLYTSCTGALIAYNTLQDFRAPNATSGSINGIYCNLISATPHKIYNNTIAMGYPTSISSSAVGFVVGALGYIASANIDIRNNIFYVNATLTGASGSFAAALRRTAGTANTAPTEIQITSNNNIYYVPSIANSYMYCESATPVNAFSNWSSITPSVPNNVVYDGSFNTNCGKYKLFLSGRESNSFVEDPVFAGGSTYPNNLIPAPSGSSYTLNGGQPLGFATDYFNTTVNTTTPDIGAAEFTSGNVYVTDNSAPLISYSTTLGTMCLSTYKYRARITDANGINTTAGSAPRVWYKKSTETDVMPATNTSANSGWKFTEGVRIGTTDTFEFTIDYTLLPSGAPVVGNIYQFFTVAQDPTGNTGYNSFGFPAAYCPSSVALSAGAFPTSGTATIKTFTIGAAIDPTLTASPASICGSGTSTITGSAIATDQMLTRIWETSPTGSSTWSPITSTTATTFVTGTLTTANDGVKFRTTVSCPSNNPAIAMDTAKVSIGNCQYAVTRNTGITYNSIITTGTGTTYTSLSASDDGYTNFVPLTGTTFKYNSAPVTQFFATSNGTMSFSSTQSNHTSYGNLTGNSLVLAPFWTDLVIQGNTLTNKDASMRYKINGVLGSGTADIIVEWAEMEGFSFTNPNMNFQVVLHESDNSIDFNYGKIQKFDGGLTNTGTFSTTCGIGMNGATPATVSLDQRLILQNENSTNFGTTSVTTLIKSPECYSQLHFLPAANYSGGTAPSSIPSNDDNSTAININVNPSPCTDYCGSIYSSKNATASTGTTVCSATTPGNADDDVWFTFNASGNTPNHKIVVTPSVIYDAVVQVLDQSYTPIACINATGIGITETITSIALNPGQQYYIRVYDAATGASGSGEFSICVSEIVNPPVNDDPAGAIVLTPSSVCNAVSSILPDALGATATAGIQVCNAGTAGTPDDDQWFKFTTSADTGVNYRINVTGVSTYNAVLQLFKGVPSTANSVNCVNATANGGTETIVSNTLATNTDYYVRVYHSGTGFANGNFNICIKADTPSCVTPTTPINNTTVTTSNATLTWNAVTSATSYLVYASTTYPVINPANLVATLPLGSTTYSLPITSNNTYYWSVVPKNSYITNTTCARVDTFNTLPPQITSVTLGATCASSTLLTINGVNLGSATNVSIGGTNITPLTSNSATKITATISTPVSGTVSVTNVSGTGVSVSSITFSNPPSITATGTAAICNGASTPLGVSSSNAGYTYTWTPGTLSGASQSVTPAATTTYTVSAVDGAGCAISTTVLVTVNSLPSVVSVTPTSATKCSIDPALLLTASGGLTNINTFTETANVLPSTFSVVNTAGTGSAALNTTYYSEGTGSVLFNTASTSANVSYQMNSNIDLTGSTDAQLTFSQIVGMEGNTYSYDLGYVEYSTDGGTSWTTFPNSSYAGSGTLITTQGISTTVSGVIFSDKSYTDWNAQFTGTGSTPGTGPATSLWKNETVNIPAAALTSNQFRVRFRYTTDGSANYYGWLLDNIKINKTASAPLTWANASGLYTNSGATTNYTGTASTTVYALPSATTNYTVTATSAAGCTATSTVAITVNAPTLPTTVGTYTSSTVNQLDGTSIDYSASCNQLAKITDTIGNNVLGNTTVSSTLSTTVSAPNADGYIYGRRNYTVAAASNGSALVRLYFTQADFDNYNANATGFLQLPTSGNNADPNMQYFRIATVIGGAYTISGSLGTSLNWNSTTSQWEVDVPVAMVNAQYNIVTMPSCSAVTVSGLAAANATGTTVDLSWTNVTSPAWGWYSLQYRIVGSPTWIYAGTTNNGVVTKQLVGLTAGSNYEVQVRRHCSSQSEGPWSSSVTFTTLSTGCGLPMTFNTPTGSATSVTVTWTAVSGAAWYEFRYGVSGSNVWTNGGTLGGSATTNTFTGLASGTSYDVQGRTFCPDGSASAWSASATYNTVATGCALPMTFNTPTGSATSVTVTWTAVSGAAWYEFRYGVSGSNVWTNGGTLGGSATTNTFTGLSSGTSYDVQGRTFCPDGSASAWSASATYNTVASGCALPPTLSASTVNATDITYTWTAVTGASWYEFRHGVSGSNVWTSDGTLGGSATSNFITGLNSGTSYDIQARTYCADGSASAWAGITQVMPSASGCSLPPVFTTDSIVNTTAYLSWPAVTGAGWYQFQYKESSASTWTSWGTLGASATTIVVSGLTASTSYDFQGLTYCGNGVPSAWSASTTFVTGVAAKFSSSTVIANSIENAISIYPNPTKGIVNVDVTLTEASILTLKVMDMSGRVVKQIQTNSTEGMNHINVNLENLSPGMYTLQLYANEVLSNVTRIRKD